MFPARTTSIKLRERRERRTAARKTASRRQKSA